MRKPGKVRKLSWEKGKPVTVSDLTKAEALAWQAKMDAFKAAKMKALEQQWGVSNGTDTQALLDALNVGMIAMPPWLYAALKQKLAEPFGPMRQQPSIHWGRWMLVREGRAKGLSLRKAYDYASAEACLIGPPYAGAWRAMKRSYDIVQKALRGGRKQIAPFRS